MAPRARLPLRRPALRPAPRPGSPRPRAGGQRRPGVGGRHLPMPVLESGIRAIVPHLAPTTLALEAMAHAILTTDTRSKVATLTLRLNDAEVRLTGVAKGAAMIGPNMATTLSLVFT